MSLFIHQIILIQNAILYIFRQETSVELVLSIGMNIACLITTELRHRTCTFRRQGDKRIEDFEKFHMVTKRSGRAPSTFTIKTQKTVK